MHVPDGFLDATTSIATAGVAPAGERRAQDAVDCRPRRFDRAINNRGKVNTLNT